VELTLPLTGKTQELTDSASKEKPQELTQFVKHTITSKTLSKPLQVLQGIPVTTQPFKQYQSLTEAKKHDAKHPETILALAKQSTSKSAEDV
tara:strand:+ start:140 stop:415 length:276 start_codon:yes stop_codon:yes gene_type:complete